MPWMRSVIGRICSTEAAASLAKSALALSDCSAVLLVSLKTSLVRRASSSMVRDSSRAAWATVSTFSRVLTTASTVELDLVLVSSAALAIASVVIANGGDSFDQLRGDLFDRAFEFRG